MDDLIIILPCGFTSLYKDIFYNKSKFPCPVCQDHDITSQDCLNMTKNKMTIKEKDFDLKKENFARFLERLEANETDPEYIINKTYGDIENQIDLRREEVKLILNEKIDKYYEKLLKKINSEKATKLNEFRDNNQKLKSLKQDFECLELENILDIHYKFRIIDDYLNKINNGMELIKNSEYNIKANKWIFSNGTFSSYQIEKLFGELNLKEETSNCKISKDLDVGFKFTIDNILESIMFNIVIDKNIKSESFEYKNLMWTIKANLSPDSNCKHFLGIELVCNSIFDAQIDYIKISGNIKILHPHDIEKNFVSQCENIFSKENPTWRNRQFISLNEIFDNDYCDYDSNYNNYGCITIEVCLNTDISENYIEN